jgi:hypothetical protein
MKIHTQLVTLTATIVLGIAPALALAAGPPTHPTGPPSHPPNGQPTATPAGPSTSASTGPSATTPLSNESTGHRRSTPGPSASRTVKARAYGKYCQTESKHHVDGRPGTPFSQCVTDMAKVADATSNAPRVDCQDESRQHLAGQHGTPFSLCISGAAELLRDQSSTGAASNPSSATARGR